MRDGSGIRIIEQGDRLGELNGHQQVVGDIQQATDSDDQVAHEEAVK